MKKLSAIIFVGLLSGCAVEGYQTGTRIVLDWTQVKDFGQYQKDADECNRIGAEVSGPGESAAAGALAGVLLGAALGAIIGDSGDFALQGAGAGAVSGAASGAAHGALSRDQVVKNCMRGRGYNVLN